LDFFLAEAEWIGCDSTLQAMSYAMEVVEEIENRERQVSMSAHFGWLVYLNYSNGLPNLDSVP
jgi:hypothetical protein